MKVAANRSICVRLRSPADRWIESQIAVDTAADMHDIEIVEIERMGISLVVPSTRPRPARLRGERRGRWAAAWNRGWLPPGVGCVRRLCFRPI